jgi:glutathionylspermidine synthase
MMTDSFGRNIPRAQLTVIEPPWKLLLSCKAVLAILWELFSQPS